MDKKNPLQLYFRSRCGTCCSYVLHAPALPAALCILMCGVARCTKRHALLAAPICLLNHIGYTLQVNEDVLDLVMQYMEYHSVAGRSDKVCI